LKKQDENLGPSSSVDFTVDGLQFIVPEDEREEFGPGTRAQRRRPLQAVVAQVQVFQLTQGLRRKKSNEETRLSPGAEQGVVTHSKKFESGKIETVRNSAHS